MTTSESKGRFFYKTNRFESICITNRIELIRYANWNALLITGRVPLSVEQIAPDSADKHLQQHANTHFEPYVRWGCS